jgi:hypothetical protein
MKKMLTAIRLVSPVFECLREMLILEVHLSSYHGNTEVVKFLLEKGVDINEQNFAGDTPCGSFLGYLENILSL